MSSIVLDLQREVSSPNCDIVSVLRRSHLIASKLKLTKFDQWITYELNGYPNQEVIPDYRKVKGELKAFNPYRGWIPVIIQDAKTEQLLCENKIPNSISEIIDLCE